MTYDTSCSGNNQRKTVYCPALVAAIFAGLGCQSALAKDGDVDTGFGDLGRQIIQFDLGNGNADFASAIAVDDSGRIVVSGTANSADYVIELVAARLDADGSLDTTFGTFGGAGDGKWHRSGHNDAPGGAASVSLRAGGEPCFAGFIFDSMASLSRGFTSCMDVGSPIEYSNVSGLPGEPLSWAASTAPDPDGGFFVVGTVGAQSDSDVYLARLIVTAWNIGPDVNFYSGTGRIRIDATGNPETVRAAARVVGGAYVTGDVFLGGNPSNLPTDRDFFLVAVGDDGSSESSFVIIDLPGSNHDDRAMAVGLDNSGRILLAGTATADAEGQNREIALVRLLSPSLGDVDPNFGANGKGVRIYNFDPAHPEKDDALSGMIVDEAGRIYLVGTLYHGAGAADSSDIAVMRLTPDGDLDTTFGTGGTALLPPPPMSLGERGVAIAMQDHRPVVLGEFDVGADTGFVVHRLESGLPPLFADGFE